MPRRSSAAAATPTIGTLPRLSPPADLGPLEREIWIETVSAVEFEPEDRELLRGYATACAQYRRATAGVATGDMNALKVQAAASAQMVRFSRRLRLGPLGRRPTGTGTRVSGKAEASAYTAQPPVVVTTFKGFGRS